MLHNNKHNDVVYPMGLVPRLPHKWMISCELFRSIRSDNVQWFRKHFF
jgi:hypothetical protein